MARMTIPAAYLARKEREMALIDSGLATTLALPPPHDVADAIDQKFKLAAALRAERSLSSWAITETARPEIQHWQWGAYEFGYGYQRADLEVRGPAIYTALDVPGRGRAVETLYTGSGMSAIATLLTALLHVRGPLCVHAGRGGYGETRELCERYGERIRWVPRRRTRAADPQTAGTHIALVDSMSGDLPHGDDPMQHGTELVVFDTTCFWRDSGRVGRVLRWAHRHDVPVALVRSHAKLDCLGVEYGRLGSLVLAWRRHPGTVWMKDLVSEARSAIRLLGVAAIPAHFPPFAGGAVYAACSAARTAAIVRNTRRLAARLIATPVGRGVKVYPHGLYLTIQPQGELRIQDVKRAISGLCDALADSGLPVKHAGSFGFDFVALEWFPDPLTRRNVIRVAPGDVPATTMDAVAHGIVGWFALQSVALVTPQAPASSADHALSGR